METQDGRPVVDRDLWVALSRSKPSGMKQVDWDLIDRKTKGLVTLSLADSILLNIQVEKTTTSLWKKLGDIYQGKCLVNRLFLRKKLYSLKMSEGTSMANHLNSFNMIIAWLTYVGDDIEDEDWCILLLCSLPET